MPRTEASSGGSCSGERRYTPTGQTAASDSAAAVWTIGGRHDARRKRRVADPFVITSFTADLHRWYVVVACLVMREQHVVDCVSPNPAALELLPTTGLIPP
jgi:hypothetical protein